MCDGGMLGISMTTAMYLQTAASLKWGKFLHIAS